MDAHKEAIMDIQIKPSRLQFFDNRARRLTAMQVRAETGADYVINCVAFNGSFQPVMGYRADGVTYVLDDDYYGIAWNAADDLTMARASEGHRNYMTFIPLVRDGEKLPLYLGTDVKGARQRTACGIYENGDLWLYAVKFPTKTPEQMQTLALERGLKHALLLDGGGSTCGSSADEEVTTTRDIPIFLCVWEEVNHMDIKTYHLSVDGATKLSANFRVREFACKDGSDETLISDKLVSLLQNIRDHYGRAVTINSGYRTESYNATIGGAKASQHCKGTAADIVIAGVTPLEVARYAETLLEEGGIGLYGSFTHVDVRDSRARWDSTTGSEVAVDGFYADECPYTEPTNNVAYGARGEAVKWVQWQLTQAGHKAGIDGIFGTATKIAVRAFQTKSGLAVDGIVGPATRAKLKG